MKVLLILATSFHVKVLLILAKSFHVKVLLILATSFHVKVLLILATSFHVKVVLILAKRRQFFGSGHILKTSARKSAVYLGKIVYEIDSFLSRILQKRSTSHIDLYVLFLDASSYQLTFAFQNFEYYISTNYPTADDSSRPLC